MLSQGMFTSSVAPFVVAMVGIVMGCGLGVVYALIRHRERMAMIERGIHPDHPEKLAPDTKPPKKPVEAGSWNDWSDEN
jgi:hypothetical protein